MDFYSFYYDVFCGLNWLFIIKYLDCKKIRILHGPIISIAWVLRSKVSSLINRKECIKWKKWFDEKNFLSFFPWQTGMLGMGWRVDLHKWTTCIVLGNPCREHDCKLVKWKCTVHRDDPKLMVLSYNDIGKDGDDTFMEIWHIWG